MGYPQQNGTFADTDDVVLFGSVARTVTENGVAVETRKGVAALTLNVTAASGTSPTLDVSVETRKDANDTWRQVGTFTQATAVTAQRKCFAGLDRLVRGVATIGGTTPSFTFSLDGDLR